MAIDNARHLELALWHIRESYLCAAGLETDNAAYHEDAAREYLETVTGRRLATASLDDLSAITTQLLETKIVPA